MLDKLYSNIGAKIKSLAKWCFIVESISAIIGGIVYIATEEFIIYGFLCALVGPIVAFVSTWVLYAFGEITEDIGLMRQKYVGDKVIEQQPKNIPATHQPNKSPTAEDSLSVKQAKIRSQWDHWSEEDSSIGQCEVCGAKKQFLVYAQYQEGDSIQQKNLCFECFSQRECKPATRN